MEFKHFIFQAWKVMEFNSLSLKVIQTLRKGTVSPKNVFSPFGPQFGLKIRGGGVGPIQWIRHWVA